MKCISKIKISSDPLIFHKIRQKYHLVVENDRVVFSQLKLAIGSQGIKSDSNKLTGGRERKRERERERERGREIKIGVMLGTRNLP